MTDPVLRVRDLGVRIGRHDIVRGVSFDVLREQTLGIVGESGSGKTMTVLAASGRIKYVDGHDPARRRLAQAAAQRARRPDRLRVPGSWNVAQPAADPRPADHGIT